MLSEMEKSFKRITSMSFFDKLICHLGPVRAILHFFFSHDMHFLKYNKTSLNIVSHYIEAAFANVLVLNFFQPFIFKKRL